MPNDTGFSRPPKKSQFKPGNPKGRPKGARNKNTILREVLSGTVSIRENGVTRTVSREEAIWLATASQAMQGNLKHVEFVFAAKEKMNSKEILEAAIEALAKTLGDEAVALAKSDGRLPASESEEDLWLWAEKKGYMAPGSWAKKKDLEDYLANSEDFDPSIPNDAPPSS